MGSLARVLSLHFGAAQLTPNPFLDKHLLYSSSDKRGQWLMTSALILARTQSIFPGTFQLILFPPLFTSFEPCLEVRTSPVPVPMWVCTACPTTDNAPGGHQICRRLSN